MIIDFLKYFCRWLKIWIVIVYYYPWSSYSAYKTSEYMQEWLRWQIISKWIMCVAGCSSCVLEDINLLFTFTLLTVNEPVRSTSVNSKCLNFSYSRHSDSGGLIGGWYNWQACPWMSHHNYNAQLNSELFWSTVSSSHEVQWCMLLNPL